MTRVRFAPSPTGTLHVGNALSAVANRRFGDHLLLRIDDTDPARNVPGGEEAILADLRWLGVDWDEGPVRQSERAARHLEAARAAGLPQRFEGVMMWREDGSPTFHLASVVDDADFGITHVLRGSDHRPNEELHAALHRALGTKPPHVIHHGLVVGADGKKLSKRAEGATVASLRDAGYPAEAVRAYLEELDLPRHDVHLDLERIRSLSVDVLARLDDDDLAARLGAPVEAAPLARGAHDLVEGRALVARVLDPPARSGPVEASETLSRFAELRAPLPEVLAKDEAKAVVRELKAVGGDLRALRAALTGAERGPELWAVLRALPRDEALRRALP
ncbi:MAG TPA: glutamate--tRNA ligase family protein [Gaiellaceae bacterium]|nr:glutamate--tRNA ligase family protein [Gaiellaceae bacterium]